MDQVADVAPALWRLIGEGLCRAAHPSDSFSKKKPGDRRPGDRGGLWKINVAAALPLLLPWSPPPSSVGPHHGYSDLGTPSFVTHMSGFLPRQNVAKFLALLVERL